MISERKWKNNYSLDWTKSILSIDLDFLGNSMSTEDGVVRKDEFKFQFIKKLVDKYRDRIVFLIDHGDICKWLAKYSTPDAFDWEIVNIDHHHDIYYGEIERRDMMRDTNLHKGKVPEDSLESGWVFWMSKNWNVVRVDEILNQTSAVHRDILKHGARFHFDLGSPLNPYELDLFNKEFNYIFIALSPHYTSTDDVDYICEYLELDRKLFNEEENQ